MVHGKEPDREMIRRWRSIIEHFLNNLESALNARVKVSGGQVCVFLDSI